MKIFRSVRHKKIWQRITLGYLVIIGLMGFITRGLGYKDEIDTDIEVWVVLPFAVWYLWGHHILGLFVKE
mgnify:CR=1 FL=1